MFKSSNHKKDQKRVQRESGTMILEFVLQLLPHLQPDEPDRREAWTTVALRVNKQRKSGTKEGESETTPELTGEFVRELFEKMMKAWVDKNIKRNPQGSHTTPEELRKELTTHDDFLMLELYQLRGYGYEVMSALAKENFAETQRAKYYSKFTTGEGSIPVNSANWTGTTRFSGGPLASAPLVVMARSTLSSEYKLAELERQVERTLVRLIQIEAENKRLIGERQRLRTLEMENKRLMSMESEFKRLLSLGSESERILLLELENKRLNDRYNDLFLMMSSDKEMSVYPRSFPGLDSQNGSVVKFKAS